MSEGQRGRGSGGEAKGDKQTWSHSHPCARVHIATHCTLEQSAMDKKIIPLSVLECFLRHPPPTHTQNTAAFLQTVTVSGPDGPHLSRLMLYKHSPVFYHGPKSVLGAHQSRPITQAAAPPAWCRPDSSIECPQRTTWPQHGQKPHLSGKKWPPV